MFLNAPIFISTKTSSYAHLYAYPNINSVKRVDSTKFLSCFNSSKLSRSTHIENVALKMCKGITMVRVVYNIPVCSKRMIYFANIYLFIIYCLPARNAIHSSYVTSITLSQKRTIRLVRYVTYLSHIPD